MLLFSQQLIAVLKEKLPDKTNIANLLMETLHIGKEAAYRRLRGEIPFTLQEATNICKKYAISLDLLLGIKQKDYYNIHLNTLITENYIEQYLRLINEITDGINYIKEDPNNITYSVQTTLPHEFLFRYDFLSKVYLYTLIYQVFPKITPRNLSEVSVPPQIVEGMRKIAEIKHETNLTLILDRYSFSIFCKVIKYYRELDMISDEEIIKIKEELHFLLNDMEIYAIRGKTINNKTLNVFISQTSLDGNYEYMKGNNMEACSVRVFGIDYMSCTDPELCTMHKYWIESLLRFSTMISVSGEFYRNEYFTTQRGVINSL